MSESLCGQGPPHWTAQNSRSSLSFAPTIPALPSWKTSGPSSVCSSNLKQSSCVLVSTVTRSRLLQHALTCIPGPAKIPSSLDAIFPQARHALGPAPASGLEGVQFSWPVEQLGLISAASGSVTDTTQVLLLLEAWHHPLIFGGSQDFSVPILLQMLRWIFCSSIFVPPSLSLGEFREKNSPSSLPARRGHYPAEGPEQEEMRTWILLWAVLARWGPLQPKDQGSSQAQSPLWSLRENCRQESSQGPLSTPSQPDSDLLRLSGGLLCGPETFVLSSEA